jgi:hypothetical protein
MLKMIIFRTPAELQFEQMNSKTKALLKASLNYNQGIKDSQSIASFRC